MGVQRPEVTVYECDRCGATAEVPANEPGTPDGWIHVPTSAPEADWFCGWQCVKSYAEKRLRVAKAQAS